MVRGLKNDSRMKKGGNKQKMVLAKNPKQLTLAIIVLVIFIINGIYTVVKFKMEQNPKTASSQGAASAPKILDEMLGQNPQQPNQEGIVPAGQNQADKNQNLAQDANDIYSQTLGLQKNQSNSNSQPNAIGQAPGMNEDKVDIISQKSAKRGNTKMVSIVVESSGRVNPFMPSSEGASFSALPPPPETLPTNTDATKVITTTISGILYDQYSPSAIINIEGSDYLVKKGDTINNYKILAINKTQVIVRLGRNVYKAGVGELLSKTDLNYNTVANLNKKFGGNEVSIKVKKKGY